MTDVRSYQMLIDGNWVNASNGAMFESINPANGQVWSKVPEATESDVNEAVSAAHRQYPTGSMDLTVSDAASFAENGL